MTPTKVRVLEAAVELLGTEGLRSLTHARVDERAGLPKGSTSNFKKMERTGDSTALRYFSTPRFERHLVQY